jgi:hypothetical protein
MRFVLPVTALLSITGDAAQIIKVPLIRSPTSSERGNRRQAGNRKSTRRRIGYSPLTDHVEFGSVTQDISYLGAVSLGTPPQTFLLGIPIGVVNVDVDTGSGVLWVADKDCVGCNVSDAQLFDVSLSTTQRNGGTEFVLDYGKGNDSMAC